MSAAAIREALEKAERVFVAKPELAVIQAAGATARLIDGLRCDITGPDGEHAIAYTRGPSAAPRAAPRRAGSLVRMDDVNACLDGCSISECGHA